MKRTKILKPFVRLLTYIFEQNPYEFCLIPDKEGNIKLNDLIQAVNEEECFRHINKSHIQEVACSYPDPPVELCDNLVRAKNNIKYKKPVFAENMPTQIFAAVREKAHHHALTRGLLPSDKDFVVLSSKRELSLRIGRRKDKKPLILTINSRLAEDEGVFFYKAGEDLFLAKHIPCNAITGPQLREKKKTVLQAGSRKKAQKKTADKEPKGSYLPDAETIQANLSGKSKKRNKSSWKENKKRLRKQSQKFHNT